MLSQQVQRVLPLRDWLAGRGESERNLVGHLWSLDAEQCDSAARMAECMAQPARIGALIASLSKAEQAALARIQSYGNRIPALVLEREFGQIRTTDRYPNPRAYLLALEQPPSPVERLYILGLIQIVREPGSRSYAITPEFVAHLPSVQPRPTTLALEPVGEPGAGEYGDVYAFEHTLVTLMRLAQQDQLTVVPSGALTKASLVKLARVRNAKAQLNGVTREEHWTYIHFARRLASDAGLVRANSSGYLQVTRAALEWMRLPVRERAAHLWQTWLTSDWDELAVMCGYRIHNQFRRNVALAKRGLAALLSQLPAHAWLDLEQIVADIARVEPDFARPDGDYYAWRIETHARLSRDGFSHWDDVEGMLIRTVIWSSLHWLGMFDTAPNEAGAVSAVRLTPLGYALLHNSAFDDVQEPPALLQATFEVLVPERSSPAVRFQTGRIAELQSDQPTATFRLTRRSIQSALERGITLDEIVTFLEQATQRAIPQNVRASLAEWAGEHGRITLSEQVLLEADSAATLAQIERDRRVRLPGVQAAGEAAWAIAPADAPGLAERLRKAGYAVHSTLTPVEKPLSDRDLTVVFAALAFYAEAGSRVGYEHDASGALLRRVARLLPERQLHLAYQQRDMALTALNDALGAHHTDE